MASSSRPKRSCSLKFINYSDNVECCTKCGDYFRNLSELIKHCNKMHSEFDNEEGLLVKSEDNEICDSNSDADSENIDDEFDNEEELLLKSEDNETCDSNSDADSENIDDDNSTVCKNDKIDRPVNVVQQSSSTVIDGNESCPISDKPGHQSRKCQFCESIFSEHGQLLVHISDQHSINCPYKCTKCDLKFHTLTDRRVHVRQTHMNAAYKCDQCGAKFKSQDSLKSHLDAHSSRKISCPKCSKQFTHHANLKCHIKRIHKRKLEHFCKFCQKGFVDKTGCQRHEVLHLQDRPFKCHVCDQAYKLRRRLAVHIRDNHSGIEYKCDICNKLLKGRAHLRVHMKVHAQTSDNSVQCNYCGKMLRSRSLKTHINLIHLQSNTITCAICLKLFYSGSDYRKHFARRHSNERPFSCDTCGQSFKIKQCLNQHIRDIHCGIVHRCDICEKVFNTRACLFRHRKTHSNVKNFICQVCNKAFITIGKLTAHQNIHTGEKPYECKICNKRFNQENNLTRHRVVHSKEKSFQCDWCRKSFNLNANLKRHQQSYCSMRAAHL